MSVPTASPMSLIFGMLGVMGFSLTLPMTRMAIVDLNPTFVGLGRAIVAAGIASVFLWVGKAPRPAGRQWLRLGATSLGVVIGFPLLSTWALESVPSAHGAVIVGTLPLATALFGAWLAGERPNLIFWGATIVGSATIAVFSFSSVGGAFRLADFFLLCAVISAGFGYAEGARLSRELGAWQTISWALLLSVPVLIVPVFQSAPASLFHYDINDGTMSMEKLDRMVNSLNWHSLFLGSSSTSRLLAGICHFVLVG